MWSVSANVWNPITGQNRPLPLSGLCPAQARRRRRKTVAPESSFPEDIVPQRQRAQESRGSPW